jgi:hypothetical protein
MSVAGQVSGAADMATESRNTMRSKTWVVLALALSMTVLTACEENEQDRVLLYKKGTYLGPPDTALTEEQIDALRFRAALQGGN